MQHMHYCKDQLGKFKIPPPQIQLATCFHLKTSILWKTQPATSLEINKNLGLITKIIYVCEPAETPVLSYDLPAQCDLANQDNKWPVKKQRPHQTHAHRTKTDKKHKMTEIKGADQFFCIAAM